MELSAMFHTGSDHYENTSKHETLSQCCFNVGPASKTVGQHQNIIGTTVRIYLLGSVKCFCFFYESSA